MIAAVECGVQEGWLSGWLSLVSTAVAGGAGSSVHAPCLADDVTQPSCSPAPLPPHPHPPCSKTVHMLAPGEAIFSTFMDGGYKQMWGTSMACPMVAGTAALLQAHAMR